MDSLYCNYWFSQSCGLARQSSTPCNVVPLRVMLAGVTHAAALSWEPAGLEHQRLPFSSSSSFFLLGLSSFRNLAHGSFVSAGFQESKRKSTELSEIRSGHWNASWHLFVWALESQLCVSVPNCMVSGIRSVP
jgi:hypothetical protein